MKRMIIIILIASLVMIGLTFQAYAKVKRTDALKVANHWIMFIIEKKGSWGGSETARVEEIQELKRKGKKIGYFCRISPRGFIIVSLRKGLAPVKAYSADNDLDPASDVGLSDLIKGNMARIIDKIEKRHGPLDIVTNKDLEDMLEINYKSAWDKLIGPQGGKTSADFQSDISTMNYQGGDPPLVSSSWHQDYPYNNDIPAPPSSDDCTAARCLVGCVATAGAQIMYYWGWPPYGVGSPYNDPYDWPNMKDTDAGHDPPEAVAELNHEIGLAVGMDYCGGDGCQSSSDTYDMEGVFENHYRYSTAATKRDRDDYTAIDWFNMLKANFNTNRPVQYRIKKHSIVGDGWQESGTPLVRQYHMNYGWNNGFNTWYTLDALHQVDPVGTINDEYVILNIYPVVAMGSGVSGTYAKQSFPYRYFDKDAAGSSATFQSGQYLQFLPNITVTNTSTTGGSFRFEGSSSLHTRMFTRGNTSAGVKITNGTIKMNRYGSVTFR
jgi:hypothetical protein